MSYGLLGSVGIRWLSSGSSRSGGSSLVPARRVLEVVAGQEREQLADRRQDRRHRWPTVKWLTPLVELWVAGTAELFLGDVFMGDGLDDLGPGDEHVRLVPSTMKMKSVIAGE